MDEAWLFFAFERQLESPTPDGSPAPASARGECCFVVKRCLTMQRRDISRVGRMATHSHVHNLLIPHQLDARRCAARHIPPATPWFSTSPAPVNMPVSPDSVTSAAAAYLLSQFQIYVLVNPKVSIHVECLRTSCRFTKCAAASKWPTSSDVHGYSRQHSQRI